MIESKIPDNLEFTHIQQLVEEFWLDNADMQIQQFRILSENGTLIAFGRLREHTDATELCTLGVAKEFQGKGYGEKMVKELINGAKRDVFLVTVIPGFFLKCGFEFVENYPESLQKKVEMCSTHYHVGETYRVMKLKNNP